MTPEQKMRNELRSIANVFAGQDEAVTQALVDNLKPETRAELHKLAGDLATMLKPPDAADNGNREHVETGIATSPTAIAEQADRTDDNEAEHEESPTARRAAADAMPGLGRIGR